MKKNKDIFDGTEYEGMTKEQRIKALEEKMSKTTWTKEDEKARRMAIKYGRGAPNW